MNKIIYVYLALELNYFGKEEDFALWHELSGAVFQKSHLYLKTNDWSSWTPSWKFWLAVPHKYCTPRDVALKKNIWNEFGFSISNDTPQESESRNRVFIK